MADHFAEWAGESPFCEITRMCRLSCIPGTYFAESYGLSLSNVENHPFYRMEVLFCRMIIATQICIMVHTSINTNLRFVIHEH
eukprot:6214185-Pleurochrysis_carterae.AAC.1